MECVQRPGKDVQGIFFVKRVAHLPGQRQRTFGLDTSQGGLVQDMMDWLAEREDFPPPDERTVQRTVSTTWKELVL